MPDGIILKALSGFYYVEDALGGELVECRARGKLRLRSDAPLVGDRAEYLATEPGKGYLMSIYPRKNSFVRPAVANLDMIVIVASDANPVTDTFLIDRLTVAARASACEPIICVNKSDLSPRGRLFDIYSSAGLKTVATSAETGEGIGELLDTIRGSVCAFTGNSGVGKSSVLNRLAADALMNVGGLSRKLGRGRHTTRHVEMFKLPGGAVVADTPGFSVFDTERIAAKEELQNLFPDFEPYLGGCAYRDCMHVAEPDCRVLEAAGKGNIQKTRHDSYVRLFAQAKEIKEWE